MIEISLLVLVALPNFLVGMVCGALLLQHTAGDAMWEWIARYRDWERTQNRKFDQVSHSIRLLRLSIEAYMKEKGDE